MENTTRIKNSEQKIIYTIAFVYIALFLYWIIDSRDVILFTLEYFSDSPLDNLQFLVPYILLIVAIIGFFKIRSWGWILLVIFIVFSAMGILISMTTLLLFYTGSQEDEFLYLSQPLPVMVIIELIIHLASLLVLCRKAIRYHYKISTMTMGIVIISTITVAVGLWALSSAG